MPEEYNPLKLTYEMVAPLKCPQISDLPSPPIGKTGWPWTVGTLPITESFPNGGPWPAISVITPSFNQGRFLEETIRSVLLQGYPDLEYIIIDGGSTDGSIDIIKRYEPWLEYWVSQRDTGQPNALNRGFRRATGEILAWLNSDDVFMQKALWRVAWDFRKYPETDILYGSCLHISENGARLERHRAPCFNKEKLLVRNFISQPSTFFRKHVISDVGYINESLHLCFDYEMWIHSASMFTFRNTSRCLSKFRHHGTSKSISQRLAMERETAAIGIRYLDGLQHKDSKTETLLGYLHLKMAVLIWKEKGSGSKEVLALLRRIKNLPAVLTHMPFLQNVVLCFLTTSPTETSDHLSDIQAFYSRFLSPRLPGQSNKYLSCLNCRACITLSFFEKSPILFFQGMRAKPSYFLRITYNAVKNMFLSF